MVRVCIGVDVGGTNTDAVVMYKREIIAKTKQPTTLDVTVAVQNALSLVLQQLSKQFKDAVIARVNIGTTHFLNAVLQRKNLAKVGVIRLCGLVSRSLPAFSDFPQDLREVVDGGCHYIDGGYEFDGKEIGKVKTEEVLQVIQQLKQSGIKHIVVSGIFSPICTYQETAVGDIIKKHYPDASFTLSHQVANVGYLERENSSILNESLKPLGVTSIASFTKAVRDVGLKCPIYFTQNDGTILSAEKSVKLPVLTFSSGPTNSMRGAAFLSNKKDAIVIDIGGTSTDVGVLLNGFPRQASTRVKCGGVTTNFRMPDVLCVALGGGSIVKTGEGKVKVGPESVGYKLITKALVYGGSTLTTTDCAVSHGLCKIGEPSKVKNLDKTMVENVLSKIHEIVEESIDQVKVKAEDQPLILVGGGGVLINTQKHIAGTSVVIKPDHFEVANAVGAALSQVSGAVDQIVDLTETPRDDALKQMEQRAIAKAIENGAHAESVVVVEKSDNILGYLKGNACRIQIKVVGDLALPQEDENGENISSVDIKTDLESSNLAFASAATGATPENAVQPTENETKEDHEVVKDKEPFIEPSTGDWLLNEFDLLCISTGAGIFGCGGGGSTYLSRVRATMALRSGKKIRVIHPENLPKTGLISSVAFMGAPSVLLEKLPGLTETRTALENSQNALICDQLNAELEETEHGTTFVKNWNIPESLQIPKDKKIVAIMCAEVGGFNSFEPLILSAEIGLPVVDCDGMGRAYPELQMFVPSIYGQSLCPASLVSSNGGKGHAITRCNTPKSLENHFRQLVVTETGCSAAIGLAALTAKQLRETTVQFSMSRAWRLGHSVLMARKEKRSPLEAIMRVENGKLLMSGKVTDVERNVEGGFNKGDVKLAGIGEYSGLLFVVKFQNENLVVEKVMSDGQRQLLATTPDLITLVESDTGESIQTEDVRYGLRLSIIILPCSPLLTSEKGLNVVGPKAFGYDVGYSPTLEYQPCVPLPKPREHQQ